MSFSRVLRQSGWGRGGGPQTPPVLLQGSGRTIPPRPSFRIMMVAKKALAVMQVTEVASTSAVLRKIVDYGSRLIQWGGATYLKG